MRAVSIREPGGVDVLVVKEVADLTPPLAHVRVRVAFAGLNRADIMQRMGFYPPPFGASPDIPGLEFSGVVDAIGESVSAVAVGDRVYGLTAGGAYAEQVVVHERELAKTPGGVSDEAAAAIPEAFITAYDALVVRGRLQPGERVLIHAIGSGVGTAGSQIAHALGCKVVGTSRTQDKLDRAKALGMSVGALADGKSADLAKAIEKVCPEGIDVVLELVGGSYVDTDIAVCAPKGRIVVVGLTGGSSCDVALGAVLRKRLEIVGTMLRARPLEEKIEAASILRKTISPWLERKIVQPVIDKVFPMAEVGKAHAFMESNNSFGKVLLAIS